MPTVIRRDEVMTWKECQYLLSRHSGRIARLAFVGSDSRPVMIPARFTLLDGTLVLQSGDAALIDIAASTPQVAVMVDTAGSDGRSLVWSVVAHGILSLSDGIPRDWTGQSAEESLPPEEGEHYLHIVVQALTGTRHSGGYAESAEGELASPESTMAATITSI